MIRPLLCYSIIVNPVNSWMNLWRIFNIGKSFSCFWQNKTFRLLFMRTLLENARVYKRGNENEYFTSVTQIGGSLHTFGSVKTWVMALCVSMTKFRCPMLGNTDLNKQIPILLTPYFRLNVSLAVIVKTDNVSNNKGLLYIQMRLS